MKRKKTTEKEEPKPIPAQCTYCGYPVQIVPSDQINTKRFALKEPVTCLHCGSVVNEVIFDSYNRGWCRRKST